MRNKWSRERIIRHILERQAKGQSLTVGGEGFDLLLYNAARRIFGSWRNAIQAAGIPPEHVLTWGRWSPAKILMVIRNLARRHRPVNTVQLEQRYGTMLSAARRHFGSWTKAVLAAGVDPTRLQRVVPWNQERVIEAILTRALRNESLAPRFVQPRSLVDAGQRFFGGWAAAVTAAGLDPKMTKLPPERPAQSRMARTEASLSNPLRKSRLLWNKELVIAALQARVRDLKPVHPTALAREDSGLYRATRRHHKSWGNAMRAAGLDPAVYRRGSHGQRPSSGPIPCEQITRVSQGDDALRPNHPA